jgi:hypothetical protein
MRRTTALLFSTAVGICLLGGCAGQKYQPTKSGFLSQYHHMTPVDATTSRYVDAPRLRVYNKFKISSVQVLVKNYNGQPLTAEQQNKMTDYIRASITSALQDKYPVVQSSSAETAEIRVAVTDAYKSGNQLGISVEGEIQDSYSAVQVAAVVRTDLGGIYIGDWWDKTSAREIVDGWSQRLRQTIDNAHAR